jgi:hypothetical protein
MQVLLVGDSLLECGMNAPAPVAVLTHPVPDRWSQRGRSSDYCFATSIT